MNDEECRLLYSSWGPLEVLQPHIYVVLVNFKAYMALILVPSGSQILALAHPQYSEARECCPILAYVVRRGPSNLGYFPAH